MLPFILGVIVGGIVGFLTCAVFSVARINELTEARYRKEAEDSDA